MKLVTLAVATLASSFVAANVEMKNYFPDCSIDCLEKGTEKATDCKVDDAVCWCVQSNYEAIYNQAVNCVMEACGADDAVESVLPAAVEFCSAASSSTSALGHQATGSSDITKTNAAVTTSVTSDGEHENTPTAASGSDDASATGSGAAVTTTAGDSGAIALGSLGCFGMLILSVAIAL